MRALIIFARMPVIGQVKTRLAAGIGDAAALKVYQRLLAHTDQASAEVGATRYVFVAGGTFIEGYFTSAQVQWRAQVDGDLGMRMQHAFTHVFEQGARSAIIIGSDLPGLTSGIIETGYDVLDRSDVALGPSADGGYYLLGMRKTAPALFQNINWSSGAVLEQTLSNLGNAGLSHSMLPVLQDVDTKEDLEAVGWKAE